MADARKLGLTDLRQLVSDAGELAKGTALFDQGGLAHLSRYQGKLYCEARGSGPAPYKVGLSFAEDGGVKARCGCMAARSRPYCKHAAALLVAWARAPEGFVVADSAPPEATGAAKRKTVKKGDGSGVELMRQGIERVGTLVRELGLSGAASLTDDRLEQIRALGESLREHRLRRLSARTLDLVGLLERGRRGDLPATAYMDVVADLLLTTRKLDKHLAGEALEDRYVEELIGKTWRKTDRTPIDGLNLVEVAFTTRTTSDGFLIRESRFVDLGDGAHYAEKQILPAMLVKRTEPKRSHAGRVLQGVRGGCYPGFAPLRLDIEEIGGSVLLDRVTLARLAEVSLPSVGKALAALQERRRDVFAPPRVPVAVRVGMVLSRQGRALIVDQEGQALYLPAGDVLEQRLAPMLRERRLCALFGDVDLDAALPTLFPTAALLEGPRGSALEPLAAEAGPPPAVRSWTQAARDAQASSAAISLAEIREELAFSFVAGLATLIPRTTDPLVARLREVGLDKQAALLDQTARRAEPAERLDDLVKLYQVLEIALVRLLSAIPVDRAAIVPVPTYESVFVPRPERQLLPADVAIRHARGELTLYEAAAQYAGHYASLPADELGAQIFPTWADGAASPYVVRGIAAHGGTAVAAARRALGPWSPRVARMTAVQVLAAVGDDEARALLEEVREKERDVVLRVMAADQLELLAARAGAPPGPRHTALDERRMSAQRHALGESQRDDRIDALRQLCEIGDRAALPTVRTIFFTDVSGEVRDAAAIALADLLDLDVVPRLVATLLSRKDDDGAARVAAAALGYMGDARGLEPLLAAWAEGWKPGIVSDALRALGAAALDAMLQLVEARPELAARKAALDVFGKQPPADLTTAILRRLEATTPALPARAPILLKISALNDEAHIAVARALLALLPPPTTKEERALHRAAHKAAAASEPLRG